MFGLMKKELHGKHFPDNVIAAMVMWKIVLCSVKLALSVIVLLVPVVVSMEINRT